MLHKVSDAFNGREFKYTYLLKNLVQKIVKKDYHCHIVFTTSWRYGRTVEELKNLIEKSEPSIIWNHKNIFYDKTITAEHIPPEYNGSRFYEIKEYLNRHDIHGDYVVFDDCDSLFYSIIDSKKVYLISDSFGNRIDQNYQNHDGEFIYDFFDHVERKFNQSYVSTYKPKIKDGYLTEKEILKAERILNVF